jgi:hypothetical protein
MSAYFEKNELILLTFLRHMVGFQGKMKVALLTQHMKLYPKCSLLYHCPYISEYIVISSTNKNPCQLHM